MLTTIRKWGNSAGVVLPASVMAEVGLNLEDQLEVMVEADTIVLRSPNGLSAMREKLMTQLATSINELKDAKDDGGTDKEKLNSVKGRLEETLAMISSMRKSKPEDNRS
jgi:antitoxin component of MazEF toxin-antitoxin module